MRTVAKATTRITEWRTEAPAVRAHVYVSKDILASITLGAQTVVQGPFANQAARLRVSVCEPVQQAEQDAYLLARSG
jgi:hypothetical protein